MKTKNLVAIILGILCAVILASALIWKILDVKPEKPAEPPKENQSSQQQPEDEPEQSGPDEQDAEKENQEPEKSEEPEESDEPNETPKPQEKPSESDNAALYDEVYTGNANPDTLTKEEATALLSNKYMVLTNRSNVLPDGYEGIDLVSYGDHQMTDVALDALKRIMVDGKNAGYNYVLYSGWRSYSRQYNNYYNKINYYKNSGYSEEEAVRLTNQYYAPPGTSEHHTGLAADVCIPSIVNKYACLHENYEQTDEYKWFSARAHEYGFILRYRKGDEEITGYNFEPWHYRFVGVDVATEIHRRDITFEEYIEEVQNRLSELN